MLDRSREMICLIDEHYWKRLWCLFEVAAFYRRAGPQRMVFIPLHIASLQTFNIVFLPLMLCIWTLPLLFAAFFKPEDRSLPSGPGWWDTRASWISCVWQNLHATRSARHCRDVHGFPWHLCFQ